MKTKTIKLFLGILLFVSVAANVSGQISVRSMESTDNVEIVHPYDSLSNFEFNYDIIHKDYYSYEDAERNIEPQLSQFVNQKIYFPDFTKKEIAFYEQWHLSGDFPKLRGKYYTIYAVEARIEKSFSGTYKLKNMTFRLIDDRGAKTKWTTDFPSHDALLVGYYEKLKSESIGRKFIYNGVVKGKGAHFINPYLTHKTLNTRSNQIIPLLYGEEWECKDIQLVDDDGRIQQLYATFQNAKDEEVLVKIRNEFNTIEGEDLAFFTCFMREDEYNAYKSDLINRFGKDNAVTILEHRVSLGMTEDMCRESWGSPTKINSTHMAGKSLTQWVYGDSSFLYFDNGILTSVQN